MDFLTQGLAAGLATALKAAILSLDSAAAPSQTVKGLVHQRREMRKYLLGNGKPLMDSEYEVTPPAVCNKMVTLVSGRYIFVFYMLGSSTEAARPESQ